jgi:hypothetical protein
VSGLRRVDGASGAFWILDPSTTQPSTTVNETSTANNASSPKIDSTIHLVGGLLDEIEQMAASEIEQQAAAPASRRLRRSVSLMHLEALGTVDVASKIDTLDIDDERVEYHCAFAALSE